MADDEAKLAEEKGAKISHILGFVGLALDQNGNLHHSSAGTTHLSPTLSQKMDPDSIFPLASATKIITAIAALRLVEQGTLSLDDPSIVESFLPELSKQDIISSPPGRPLTYEPRKHPITLRQLLTHTSGSGADFIDPRLLAWRKSRDERPMQLTAPLPDAVCIPSLFQPGEGWAYGGGSDWVGLLISRIADEPLSAFLRREVFDAVGCDFRIGFSQLNIEENGGVVVQIVKRRANGTLIPHYVAEQKSERGGAGLFASSSNFIKIIGDLIAPNPKILNKDSLAVLFAPQLADPSPALTSFREQLPLFSGMTAALTQSLPTAAINYALGGLLITQDNPALGKTKGTMVWGGAYGSVWFANRDEGVAVFFGASLFPPGDEGVGEVVAGVVRGAWRMVARGEEEGMGVDEVKGKEVDDGWGDSVMNVGSLLGRMEGRPG